MDRSMKLKAVDGVLQKLRARAQQITPTIESLNRERMALDGAVEGMEALQSVLRAQSNRTQFEADAKPPADTKAA